MPYKYSIITSFLGDIKNRFIQYSKPKTIAEKLEIAGSIDGIDGVELCYPGDFDDIDLLKSLLKDQGLSVSAINVRSRKSFGWFKGSFSSENKNERDEFVDTYKKAIDAASYLDAQNITNCPLNDGHDYPFEMNYDHAYQNAEECFSKIAEYAARQDIRISIEYKLNDPRERCFFASAGEALSFCQTINNDFLGVTLDVGHSLLVGERPAQAATMLFRANKLFYMHMNDNDRIWDWDMVPGMYHLVDIVEFLYVLDELGCQNQWFAFDIYPKENDAKDIFATSARIMRKLENLSSRIDRKIMDRARNSRDVVSSINVITDLLLGE